jgi:hypothetical protein
VVRQCDVRACDAARAPPLRNAAARHRAGRSALAWPAAGSRRCCKAARLRARCTHDGLLHGAVGGAGQSPTFLPEKPCRLFCLLRTWGSAIDQNRPWGRCIGMHGCTGGRCWGFSYAGSRGTRGLGGSARSVACMEHSRRTREPEHVDCGRNRAMRPLACINRKSARSSGADAGPAAGNVNATRNVQKNQSASCTACGAPGRRLLLRARTTRLEFDGLGDVNLRTTQRSPTKELARRALAVKRT